MRTIVATSGKTARGVWEIEVLTIGLETSLGDGDGARVSSWNEEFGASHLKTETTRTCPFLLV